MTTINLTSDQLLDISQNIRRNFKYRLSTTVTELVLLPVDPYHLHAYWSLDSQTASILAAENHTLMLRFYWHNKQLEDFAASSCYFNIEINADQSYQRIRVPMNNCYYSGVIGLLTQNQRLNVLTKSNTIHVPRVGMLPVTDKKSTIRVNESPRSEQIKQASCNLIGENHLDEVMTHHAILKDLRDHCSDSVTSNQLLSSQGIASETNGSDVTQNQYEESRIDAMMTHRLNILPHPSGQNFL
ncbi:MAG TPA: DUF4912 domain-containing protein [Crenotrichaceae bacterium]|nr:DUF4912 domain-containing protein [Crenotrichaceae bacterium]